ncbi:MAG: hypothetical protein NXI24_11645 [bacterium]|nr:hypothetical protein [bacterium]
MIPPRLNPIFRIRFRAIFFGALIVLSALANHSCEIGNIIHKDAAPDFNAAQAGDILLLPPLDRSDSIDPETFAAAFRLRLRDYSPAYRFRVVDSDPPGLSGSFLESLDASAGGPDTAAAWPAIDRRPRILAERFFAVTIVRENSIRRERRPEYIGGEGGDSVWRDLIYTTRVFRADFMIFAPDLAKPAFFARYERESEESNADEYAQDDESPAQICLDAIGQCLFNSALQIVSGGRADSAYDDDVSRFMKTVALELPED